MRPTRPCGGPLVSLSPPSLLCADTLSCPRPAKARATCRARLHNPVLGCGLPFVGVVSCAKLASSVTWGENTDLRAHPSVRTNSPSAGVLVSALFLPIVLRSSFIFLPLLACGVLGGRDVCSLPLAVFRPPPCVFFFIFFHFLIFYFGVLSATVVFIYFYFPRRPSGAWSLIDLSWGGGVRCGCSGRFGVVDASLVRYDAFGGDGGAAGECGWRDVSPGLVRCDAFVGDVGWKWRARVGRVELFWKRGFYGGTNKQACSTRYDALLFVDTRLSSIVTWFLDFESHWRPT